MQTRFTPAQLADPDTAASERILRTCVHCGFCLATCPTYVLLGDELDSPRGRIYLIREMLESGASPSPDVVRHLDRCLSCLACMTTCPSGVHYQHLIDHARVHVERNFRRPWPDRLLRAMLAAILPHPRRFRFALRLAHRTRGLHRWLPGRLRAISAMAPARLPPRDRAPGVASAAAARPQAAVKARVALLHGCVQPVLAPSITAAAQRLLERAGAEVIPVSGCCGALAHHLGREPDARTQASKLIERLQQEIAGPGLDAVVSTASGCGTHVKDFAWLFRDDPAAAAAASPATATTTATSANASAAAAVAAAVAGLARDVTEVLGTLGLPRVTQRPGLKVAYHSACSMQHGQKIDREPRALLAQAGFDVVDIAEGHLCCGSAGTYNLLQPELAARLRERKIENIRTSGPDLVATGNIGCMTQLAGHCPVPIVHTVELLDWATGGPRPAAIA